MQGYIKDYRKEIESDVWLMPPLYHRTWQWLKYNVNHEEAIIPMRDGTELQIKRGQRLTSIRDLAKSIGWYEGVKWKEPNPKTISVILDFMVKKGMIEINQGKGNRQYTLITLINWEVYNPKSIEGNSKVTPRTTGREHPVDINKNDLNDLNDLDIKRTTTITDPFIFVLDEYCNLHNKIDLNIKESERVEIRNLLSEDITPEFIVESMKKLHKRKIERGESVTNFLYYPKPIREGWNNQKVGDNGAKHEGVSQNVRYVGNPRKNKPDEEQSRVYPGRWDVPLSEVSG